MYLTISVKEIKFFFLDNEKIHFLTNMIIRLIILSSDIWPNITVSLSKWILVLSFAKWKCSSRLIKMVICECFLHNMTHSCKFKLYYRIDCINYFVHWEINLKNRNVHIFVKAEGFSGFMCRFDQTAKIETSREKAQIQKFFWIINNIY